MIIPGIVGAALGKLSFINKHCFHPYEKCTESRNYHKEKHLDKNLFLQVLFTGVAGTAKTWRCVM